MTLLRKWWSRLLGLFVAVAAIWYALSASRHHRKREQRHQKAEQLAKDKTATTAQAAIARDQAKAELHKANAAQAAGRAAIKRVEESGHESLAARIRAYNQRVRELRR